MIGDEGELALVEKLKSMDGQLFSTLQDIEKFCDGVWISNLLPWFTDHGPAHSKEIIYILGHSSAL